MPKVDKSKVRILFVDDDPSMRTMNKESLKHELGETVELSIPDTPEQVEQEIQFNSELPLIIILDINFKEWGVQWDGLDLYDKIRLKNPFTPVIFFSGNDYLENSTEKRKNLRAKYHEQKNDITKGTGSRIHLICKPIFELSESISLDCKSREFLNLDSIELAVLQGLAYNESHNILSNYFEDNPNDDYVLFTCSNGIETLEGGNSINSLEYNEIDSPVFYRLNTSKYYSSIDRIYEIKYKLDERIKSYLESKVHRVSGVMHIISSDPLERLPTSKQIYFANSLSRDWKSRTGKKRLESGMDSIKVFFDGSNVEESRSEINTSIEYTLDAKLNLVSLQYKFQDSRLFSASISKPTSVDFEEMSSLPIFFQTLYSNEVFQDLYEYNSQEFNGQLARMNYDVKINTLKNIFKKKVLEGEKYHDTYDELLRNVTIPDISTIEMVYSGSVLEINNSSNKMIVSLQDIGRYDEPKERILNLDEMTTNHIDSLNSEFEITIFRNQSGLKTLHTQLTI